jgi:hypothetical protein
VDGALVALQVKTAPPASSEPRAGSTGTTASSSTPASTR